MSKLLYLVLKKQKKEIPFCLGKYFLLYKENYEEYWELHSKPSPFFGALNEKNLVSSVSKKSVEKACYFSHKNIQIACSEWDDAAEIDLVDDVFFLLEPYTEEIWTIVKDKKKIMGNDPIIIETPNGDRIGISDWENFHLNHCKKGEKLLLIISAEFESTRRENQTIDALVEGFARNCLLECVEEQLKIKKKVKN
jgi:hypothetical protein